MGRDACVVERGRIVMMVVHPDVMVVLWVIDSGFPATTWIAAEDGVGAMNGSPRR